MESSLDDVINNAKAQPQVMGVLVADQQGLCVSSSGTLSPQSAGILAEIWSLAEQIEPKSAVKPVVVLESDQSDIYLTNEGSHTVAIQKRKWIWQHP